MIVALALGLALGIQAFIVKPYQIPSGSMEPTLDIGQRVLVNRFVYHFADPKIGDIVVFHPPEGAEPINGVPKCGATARQRGAVRHADTDEQADTNFIKRIVAGPGDTIAVQGRPSGRQRRRDHRRGLHQAVRSGGDACNLPDRRSRFRRITTS